MTCYAKVVATCSLSCWHAALTQHAFLPQFTCVGGKELKVSYPCVMLNVMVAEHNTNDQYQTLV